MKTRNILRYIIPLIAFLPAANVIAVANTPVETFIRHVKESNIFVQVSNIWQPDNDFDKTAMLQKVANAQPLTIDYTQVAALIQKNNTAISLVIPGYNGNTYTIDLAQYNSLGNNFQVHVIGNNQSDGVFDYTPGLYYSGVVEGIAGSVASFSFFNNEVYGVFSIPGVGNFNVVPNVMVGKYYNNNEHYILYNDNDLLIKDHGPQCDADKLFTPYKDAAAKTTTTLGNDVYNNCTEVRVFEVGDYSLYMTKGHSVTNVTNYLTALFNNQSTLYRNEGIPIVLNYIQVDSVTDAYAAITGANSLYFLDKFGYVTQNTLHGCDVAILASTALSDGYGALGGVAWLQSMCSTYHVYPGSPADTTGPYAFCDMDNSAVVNFPTYSWDVEVITHEMGHLVGSPHTHRCCWNPPGTGTTAIDGCYTLEGTCAIPVPALPAGGGTIMSYCHLTSDGINFSNGFGQQPGDTVRYYIAHHFSTTCGDHYTPTVAPSDKKRAISANRECTDIASGDTITYYWNDNNTASHADDTLVLAIQKHGNNIGTMDSVGFSVKSGLDTAYGSGTGLHISFPAGVTGLLENKIAMRRYWSINATTAPATAVQVMFPFLQADTSDVDGSVPGAAPLTGYMMYKVKSPVNPDPKIDSFAFTTASNISIYTYGTTPSATNWSLSTVGVTNFANMMMTNLSGGGGGFYTYNSPAGVTNVNTPDGQVYVYPNPTHDNWFVSVTKNSNDAMTFQLYTADGRMAKSQLLKSGAVNSIDATNLAPGVYFYRITGGTNVYTGNLVKK